MAIYEYWCRACGAEMDIDHPMSDSSPRACKCGAQMVKRIGSGNFILKGGGWPGKSIKSKNESFKEQVRREKQENIPGPDTLPRSG